MVEKYSEYTQEYLRSALFENPAVVKVSGCTFRDLHEPVTVYYSLLSDRFGIVNSYNQLAYFSIA